MGIMLCCMVSRVYNNVKFCNKIPLNVQLTNSNILNIYKSTKSIRGKQNNGNVISYVSKIEIGS